MKEESLNGKISGLQNKLQDRQGKFVYSCYVSSPYLPYLDARAHSKRTSFDIEGNVEGLFENEDLSLKKIRDAIFSKIQVHITDALPGNIKAAKVRIEQFVAEKASRYCPILDRIIEKNLIVDAAISDKKLDIHLYKQRAKFEREILRKGSSVLNPINGASLTDYSARIREYLVDVSDMKKSDLADYVSHRKVIIDLLEKALQKGIDGKICY